MADQLSSPASTTTDASTPPVQGGSLGGDNAAHDADGEPLVWLTALAAEKVLEIKEAEGIEDDTPLRLRVIGGGCSGFSYDLYFDPKGETDREVHSHGVHLVVDQMSLMYLLGTEIDYVEGLAGAGFKFQNPNTKSTCGCGSSFQV